jgi:actin-related protein 9
MPPREDRIIILTTGARWTRAVHGIYELFQRPYVQIPTRVGRRNNTSTSSTFDSNEYIVGTELDDLIARHERIDVIYPIRGGKVKDWNALLAVWRHILLNQLHLRVSQNDCPLLVSLPPNLSRDDQAYATRILFENFNVPSLIIAEEPLLSSYAAGALTSTVVDFGWENCTVSPVMENVGVIHTAVQRSSVGIRHIALYLAHLLSRDESVVQALIKLDATRSARSTANVDQESAGDLLAIRLFELAVELIKEGKVRAAGQGGEGEGAHARGRHREDEAEFDVAAALVAGREKAAIEEQERKNKAALEAANKTSEETGVSVPAEAEVLTAADGTSGHAQAGATDEEGSETIVFQGLRVRVSPGPLLQATEVLWDPSILLSMRGSLAKSSVRSMGQYDFGINGYVQEDFTVMRSLTDTISAAISSVVDVDRRPQLWETLLPTGAPAKLIANLNTAIVKASQAYLASNADNAPGTTALAGFGGGSTGLNSALASAGPTSRDSPGMGGDIEGGAQPTTARCIKTPDYFAEFKDRTDLAPFLGATIYAKLAFTDPFGRLVTSKAVYNEKGPSASFLISAPS